MRRRSRREEGRRFGQRRPWATCHSRSALFTSLRRVFFLFFFLFFRAFVSYETRRGSSSSGDTFSFRFFLSAPTFHSLRLSAPSLSVCWHAFVLPEASTTWSVSTCWEMCVEIHVRTRGNIESMKKETCSPTYVLWDHFRRSKMKFVSVLVYVKKSKSLLLLFDIFIFFPSRYHFIFLSFITCTLHFIFYYFVSSCYCIQWERR